eukprot:754582-Hanusia_phi.AAC.6
MEETRSRGRDKRSNRGDVKSSSCDVCAQKDPLVSIAELEEGGRSLLLLLLAMQVEHWDVDEIEKLGIELDGVARGEEDENLRGLSRTRKRLLPRTFLFKFFFKKV